MGLLFSYSRSNRHNPSEPPYTFPSSAVAVLAPLLWNLGPTLCKLLRLTPETHEGQAPEPCRASVL